MVGSVRRGSVRSGKRPVVGSVRWWEVSVVGSVRGGKYPDTGLSVLDVMRV